MTACILTPCSDTTMIPAHETRNEPPIYSRQDLHALNLLGQPVWVFDIVRRAMWYANEAAVELWSAKSLDDLLKRDFSDMSESTMHRLDDYLLKFTSDDKCVIDEQWTFYPNQLGPKTVVCKCKGISIEEGRLAMLLEGTFKETTTEAEQHALRAVEMLRHLPVAVCLTDLEGNIMEQNPEAMAVFGSVDNITRDNKADEDDDDDDDDEDDDDEKTTDCTFVKRFVDKELGRRILAETRTGQEVHRLEALQLTVMGPRWSAIEVRQTKDPVTSKPILLYSSRDISAVVEAKRQAVAADGAKMDLLADMAHAIRTPLQHVVGVVELMSREPSNDGTNRHCPNESRHSILLQSSAQLLMTVLHDMMDSVRSVNNNTAIGNHTSAHGTYPAPNPVMDHQPTPNNRVKLECAHIDVQQVLDSAIATVTPHARVKDLFINAKVTSMMRGTSVMGDANRLGQILFEILHNAVKYTSRGGILVTVRRRSRKQSRRVRLRFEVKDSGVGLNLEQQKSCLRTRSGLRKDNQDSGKGLGLELCKSLVEAMGGTIGVESKPGCGATFWFEIPFLRAAAVTTSKTNALRASSDRPRSPGSGLEPVLDDCGDEEDGGFKILLMDVNNVGRNVMTALLEQSGHSVTTVDNGPAMVQAVSQEAFDVVLMETHLPASHGDAFAAIREIRMMGYSPERLPILALTASVPRADYPELGLNDWLTKPMLIKDVQKAMTNAICNVGTKSTGTGSIFTTDDNYSLCSGVGMAKRSGSMGSIQSAFSDNLQAVLGSPDEFKSTHSQRHCSHYIDLIAPVRLGKNSDHSRKSDRPPQMTRRSTCVPLH